MSREKIIAGGMVLLFLLHQDFWLRNDSTLVFGIFPASLAYHVGFTLVTALGWWLVARFAWPSHLDEDAAGPKPPAA